MKNTIPPFITIVVPVKNEEQFIEATLKQLLSQDYSSDRFEILVVDGMSKDGTKDIVARLSPLHPQIKLVENPKGLSSAGRNIGFRMGRGDIFLVVDGHCYIPTNQLLKNIINSFEKSGAQCLGRPQPLDPPGLTTFQQAVALARGSRVGHSSNSFIYLSYEGFVSPVSVGAIYKKEVFDTIGYVDEDFDACEDVEFNYMVEKGGLKTYISPNLTIRYYPRKTLKELFNQMKRYGRGRFHFIKKHPETINFDMLVLPAFVIGLSLFFLSLLCIAGCSIYPVSPSFWPLLSGLLFAAYGLYLLLIFAESIRIALKSGWRYLWYLPFVFFMIHFGLGWGFILGIFTQQIGSNRQCISSTN
jgi:glycosyltransferase involved in cell wall biosynthesis